MIRFFFFFSFSSFPIFTHCSSFPSISPHTLHCFPLQASIPPLVANPSPYPAPTMPIDLCYLIFLVLYLSIFLHLKHQDPWSPMLSFDFVAMIDKTTLSPWLGFMLMGSIFILMNGYWFCWWLMNGVCWLLMNGGWVSLVSWWLLANLMVDDGFYFYFDERVLILLMVDEWGLLMVDEWWLGFYGWWMVVAVVVVVVMAVVVTMADGRGGCGWCCGCFLGSEIYYFIVVVILFYCIKS